VIDPKLLVPALPASQTAEAPGAAPPSAGKGSNSTQTAVDVRPPLQLGRTDVLTVQWPQHSLPICHSCSMSEWSGWLQVVLQVSGTGVTPFAVPQQTILLRAMASVLTTVSLGDLSIRYVNSAVNQRRRLLAEDVPPQVSHNALQSIPRLEVHPPVPRQPGSTGLQMQNALIRCL